MIFTYFAKLNTAIGNGFCIRQEDRLMHTYIIGKTGTGKSTMLKTCCYRIFPLVEEYVCLDPHGDLVSKVLWSHPTGAKKTMLYISTYRIFHSSLNTIPSKSNVWKAFVSCFRNIWKCLKKLWDDAWGVKLEHILRYCILTLLDQEQATIADIPKLLLDKSFRYKAMAAIKTIA